MRQFALVFAFVAFALAACGEPTTTRDAPSPSVPQPVSTSPAALLSALGLAPDAQGQVVNECGEKVTPRILAAELGGDVGTAQLVVIEGGPKRVACYGDGPDLHLMRSKGESFREIYSARGRVLIILPTLHDGVRDIADGGPGSAFPVWEWNGSEYAPAGREVADAALSDATFLP